MAAAIMRAIRQPDLFAGGEVPSVDSRPEREWPPRPAPAELGDAVLIAAIPGANFADCRALAGEAGRPRLAAAVAALEALCRRFRGFGRHSAVPEQVPALAALAAIGGRDAAAAAAGLIVDDIVQGPDWRGPTVPPRHSAHGCRRIARRCCFAIAKRRFAPTPAAAPSRSQRSLAC
jgi:hypothetical protein